MTGSKLQRRRSLRDDAVNVPNALTMMRILLIPVVLWQLDNATPRANFWAAMVYVVCTVTDFFDGFLARRMGVVSILGQFLDPLADKLLVMSTLVFMVFQGRLPWLGVIAVIITEARELSITSLRVIAMGEGVSMPAAQGGKEKAALQMLSVLFLILHHRYDILYYGIGRTSCDMNAVGVALLYLSTILSLLSGADYLRIFYDAVEAKEKRLAHDTEPRSGKENEA